VGPHGIDEKSDRRGASSRDRYAPLSIRSFSIDRERLLVVLLNGEHRGKESHARENDDRRADSNHSPTSGPRAMYLLLVNPLELVAEDEQSDDEGDKGEDFGSGAEILDAGQGAGVGIEELVSQWGKRKMGRT
jgi:hypothetical protein